MAALTTRLKRAGIVAVFTFGFTTLAAVLSGPGPATIAPAIAVFGWFILAPAVAIFDLPVIDDGDGRDRNRNRNRAAGTASAGDAENGPLETLQERYAAGEISEDEFDRKVERLLASGAGETGSARSISGSSSLDADGGLGDSVTNLDDLSSLDAGNSTGDATDASVGGRDDGEETHVEAERDSKG